MFMCKNENFEQKNRQFALKFKCFGLQIWLIKQISIEKIHGLS